MSNPSQAVEVRIETIEGGVTAPAGFVAGGSYAGIKTYGPEPRLDVGILASGPPLHRRGRLHPQRRRRRAGTAHA